MKYFFTLILFIISLNSHCQTNNLVVFVGEKISFSKIKAPYIKIDTLSGLGIDTVFTIGKKQKKLLLTQYSL